MEVHNVVLVVLGNIETASDSGGHAVAQDRQLYFLLFNKKSSTSAFCPPLPFVPAIVETFL